MCGVVAACAAVAAGEAAAPCAVEPAAVAVAVAAVLVPARRWGRRGEIGASRPPAAPLAEPAEQDAAPEEEAAVAAVGAG